MMDKQLLSYEQTYTSWTDDIPTCRCAHFTIINTRPKLAYGRQGLEGSWGQDTDEVRTFLVFLTSQFAPAALS